jgi:hypothetical protein
MNLHLRNVTVADVDFFYNLHHLAMQTHVVRTSGQWGEKNLLNSQQLMIVN